MNKTILIIISISIVALGIGTLGGYYSGRKTSKVISTPIVTPLPTSSSTPVPTLLESSPNLVMPSITPSPKIIKKISWKTYTNSDWGITFQYPNELEYNNSIVTLKESNNHISLEAPVDWAINFNRILNKTIEQRVAELPGTVLNDPEEEDLGIIKLNGYDSRQIIFKYDQGENRRILFQHGNDLIEIDTGFVVDPQPILSTLKFL